MKKMSYRKISLLFAINLLFQIIGFAQSNNTIEIIEKLNESHLFGEIVYKQKPTNGSQLLLDSWSEGTVILKNGFISNNNLLNYNGYIDQVLWFNSSKVRTVILEKEAIHEFSLFEPSTKDTLTFRNMEVKVPFYNIPPSFFAQVLYEGNIALFAFRQIVEAGIYSYQQNNSTFEIPNVKPKNIYFLKLPSNDIIPIKKINKRSIINAIPSKKEQIKRFVSHNKFSIKNEEDLIKLINFLDID
jgi:hypothetical protein